MAIGDLVKSTLGPKGMDKILWGMGQHDGTVQVTNDGATILRAVGVDNPAAKVLVDMSRVQDDEVGDGTTSVTVLASELIKEAEKLIEMRIHPQTIIAGWREATKVAQKALEAAAIDNSKDDGKFREDLMNIARTTLSSKILSQHKDFFSKLAVDAVLRLKGSGNLDAIQIIKIQGGSLMDSFLDAGFLLNKKPGLHQPKRLENAKILIANTPMDTDKIKVFGSRVKVDNVAKVAELEVAEKEKKRRCRKVTNDFNKCTTKAYQDYRAAMTAGDDGRPDFAARKACNYLQASVEDCGNMLLGECNTPEKVAEIKDNQIRGTLKNLETSIHHWDSDKCPAVKASINRMKGEPEVEYVPPSTSGYEEAAYAGASKTRGVVLAGIILLQPFILALL